MKIRECKLFESVFLLLSIACLPPNVPLKLPDVPLKLPTVRHQSNVQRPTEYFSRMGLGFHGCFKAVDFFFNHRASIAPGHNLSLLRLLRDLTPSCSGSPSCRR